MGFMSWFGKQTSNSKQSQNQQPSYHEKDCSGQQLKGNFHIDLEQLKMIFERSSDIVFREFQLAGIQDRCKKFVYVNTERI